MEVSEGDPKQSCSHAVVLTNVSVPNLVQDVPTELTYSGACATCWRARPLPYHGPVRPVHRGWALWLGWAIR